MYSCPAFAHRAGANIPSVMFNDRMRCCMEQELLLTVTDLPGLGY